MSAGPLVLHDEMFHRDCPDSVDRDRGCVRSDFLGAVPHPWQCPHHEEAHQPQRGQRDLRGYYPQSNYKRVAVDGALLDLYFGDIVVASAWLDACGCVRPDRMHFVPHRFRASARCREHTAANRQLPEVNPFLLTGEELTRAEDTEFFKVLDRCKIPLRLHRASFGTSRPTPALAAAQAYCEHLENEREGQEGLVLAGRAGCGKSHGAVCIVRQLVGTRWMSPDGIEYWFTPTLVRALLDNDERDTVFDRILAAELFVLDDLGGAGYLKKDGLAEGMIEEALIHREGESLATVLTTNLTPSAFQAALGDRIFDRLRGSWGKWVSLTNASLRGTGQTAA